MSANPWIKFYPTDWQADEKLRLCSLEARGLWVEMMCIMHKSESYGHLKIGDVKPSAQQVALMVGAPAEQVEKCLEELGAMGVFSRTKGGVIFSRRMESDEKKRRILRENGKKGGNPSLCNKIEKQILDNPRLTKGVKTQRPEARDQRLEDTPCSPPAGDDIPPPSARKKKPQRKPETPVPEEWAENPQAILLPQTNLDAAQRSGKTRQEMNDECQGFIDYCQANDKRYRDWNAAWRTRVNNWRKFRGQRRQPGNVAYLNPTSPGAGGGSIADAAARYLHQTQSQDAVSGRQAADADPVECGLFGAGGSGYR